MANMDSEDMRIKSLPDMSIYPMMAMTTDELIYVARGTISVHIEFGDKDYRKKVIAQAERLIVSLEKVGIDRHFLSEDENQYFSFSS